MSELGPLFVALAGARDRAKHEGKPVGVVGCRVEIDMHMCVITDTPQKHRDDIERAQLVALKIIERTLKIMSDDISKIVGCDVPASLVIKPKSITALTHETEGELPNMRREFLVMARHDEETMDTLAKVTATMVEHWSK